MTLSRAKREERERQEAFRALPTSVLLGNWLRVALAIDSWHNHPCGPLPGQVDRLNELKAAINERIPIPALPIKKRR